MLTEEENLGDRCYVDFIVLPGCARDAFVAFVRLKNMVIKMSGRTQ